MSERECFGGGWLVIDKKTKGDEGDEREQHQVNGRKGGNGGRGMYVRLERKDTVQAKRNEKGERQVWIWIWVLAYESQMQLQFAISNCHSQLSARPSVGPLVHQLVNRFKSAIGQLVKLVN